MNNMENTLAHFQILIPFKKKKKKKCKFKNIQISHGLLRVFDIDYVYVRESIFTELALYDIAKKIYEQHLKNNL